MRRITLALFLAVLSIGNALAGSSTINVTPGSGATYDVITDGSGHFVGQFGVCDGSAAAQCAAVKPASTAALAADPSLVVGLSPNSTLPAFAATPTVNLGTLGGAATAAIQSSVIGTLAPGVSATNSLLTGGVFNTVAPTLTNGQQAAVQFDASGNTLVNVKTGTLVVTQASGSNLHTVCDSGCIPSFPADEGAFSFGSSTVQTGGGVFQTTPTNNPLGNGQAGAFQVTSFRALHVNLRNLAGTEIGTAATPLQITGANGSFPNTAVQTPVAPATATATAGVLNGAIFNTTQPTFTNGQQGALQASSRGELLVTTGVDPVAVGGQAANAAVPVGNPVLVAGFDGTDVRYISTTNTGAVNINGTISASLGPFQPSGNYTTLAVSAVSARTALPAGSPSTVVVYNTGTVPASVTLGSGSVVATTSEDQVGPGCFIGYATGAFVDIAAITASSTTTLVISGGTGLPVGGCSPIFSGTIGTVLQGSPPWTMNLTQVNSVALGSPSNYGTSPGAVTVAGVNAFVTNTIADNIAQISGSPVSVAATGIMKVGLTDGSGNTISSSSGGLEVAQIGSIPTAATLQSAAVANGNGTVLSTVGMSGATLTVNCAACSGGTQINFEGTEDGTNYTSIVAFLIGTTTSGTSTTTAGIGVWRLNVSNLQNIRARISAYSAGTVTVTGHTTPMPDSPTTLQANIVSAPANQSVNVNQVSGSAVSVAATGVQKVGIVGNAGATLDSTVGAGTAPTDQIVVGAIYNSTEISPTATQAFALQADSKGRLRNVIMDAAGNTRGANVNASSQLSVSIDGSSSIVGVALNATPTLANGSGVVPTQGGAVLSATNGGFTNLLQGNAVLAVGNPIFVTGTGTAGTAATNPITVQGIASMTPILVNPGTAANWGVGATGSAVPANAHAIGVNTANVLAVPHICGTHVTKHITTATDTQIVAASGSTTIYVCDYEFSFGGTGNAYLEKATSGTCATLTQIAQTWYGIANGGKGAGNAYYRGLNTGASAQLCVNTSAAVSFDITVYYDQY